MALRQRTLDFSLSLQISGITDSGLFDLEISLVLNLKIALKETPIRHTEVV